MYMQYRFKQVFRIGLALITAYVLTIISSFGQSTIQSTGFPTEQNVPIFVQSTSAVGQFFVANSTGIITTISIKMDGSNLYTGTMNLWIGAEPGNGNSISGGPIYQSFEITAANLTSVITINLNTPFPVINGGSYRMVFAPVGTGQPIIDGNSSSSFPDLDSYIPGNATVFNGSYVNSLDLNFSISISPNPPIPTLSEWGLFIFGLMILNIGIFFVQWKELI